MNGSKPNSRTEIKVVIIAIGVLLASTSIVLAGISYIASWDHEEVPAWIAGVGSHLGVACVLSHFFALKRMHVFIGGYLAIFAVISVVLFVIIILDCRKYSSSEDLLVSFFPLGLVGLFGAAAWYEIIEVSRFL